MIKGLLKSPEKLYKLIICMLCTCQSTAAFVLSMVPAKRLDNNAHPNTVLLFLGSLILFLFLTGVLFCAKKPIFIAVVFTTLLNVLALVNYYELILHGTVLTHQDIRNASTAMRHIGNYKIELSKDILYIIISFLVLLLIFVVLHTRKIQFQHNYKIGAFSVAILFMLVYVLFISPQSVIKSETWSWERKYYTDGYVVGTLENLRSAFHIAIKPEGYEEILLDLKNIETGAPVRPTIESKSYPDIVLILNETYYDMNRFYDYKPDISYMKNYDKLNAYKGYATVPYTGGGTNASEYELLTCNSMTLINSSSPFNDLHFNDSPSLVKYLESLGYATMAAHPFIPGNYHRGTVWNEMGIDTSYFVSDFSELEYFGKRSYCTDSSAFQNFRKFYEQMPEDKPRFAYMLTIQNHGDWTFNDDVDNIVHIEDKHGLSDVDKERMDEYLSCIKLTDDFIDEIISYFSGNGRNVVVYMVGDHCPSLLNEPSFDHSDELNNSDLSLEEQKSSDLPKRKVPYFIWCSNLDNLSSMPDNSEIDLCALSAYAVKAAGLPLSYYFDQLLKVSAQSQCITSIDNISNGQTTIGFINGSGEEESINSDSDIAEEIRKYFCLEYNSLQNSLREDCFFTPYGF